MIDDKNPRAVIGGNQPPEPMPPDPDLIAAQLEGVGAPLKKRSADLIAAAGNTKVTDEETAETGTLLVRQIQDHASLIDETRAELKRPYLEAGRQIDAFFGGLRHPLVGSDPKVLGGAAGPLAESVDEERRKKQAREAAAAREKLRLAAIEREKAEAAQAKQRQLERERWQKQEDERRAVRLAERAVKKAETVEEHAAAQQALAAAEAKKQTVIAEARAKEEDAELQKQQSTEEAARLEQRGRQPVKAVINTGVGAKASGREQWIGTIEDLDEALAHAVRFNKGEIRAAVQAIVDQHIRAKVRVFPGVRIERVVGTKFHGG